MGEEGSKDVQDSGSCCVTGEGDSKVKQPGKSVCLRVIASAGFIIACLAMLVSYAQNKKLNDELSLMESEIWSLKRKIVSEVKSFDSNMTQIEDSMANYEKALVVTELRRIYSTVKDISRRYPDKSKDYADKVSENITMLIADLDTDASPEDAGHDAHTFSTPSTLLDPVVVPPAQMEESAHDMESAHGKMGEVFHEMMEEVVPDNDEKTENGEKSGFGHEMLQEAHPFGDINVAPGWNKNEGHSEDPTEEQLPGLIPEEEDHPAGHSDEHTEGEI